MFHQPNVFIEYAIYVVLQNHNWKLVSIHVSVLIHLQLARNVTLTNMQTLDLAVVIRTIRERLNESAVVIDMPMFILSLNLIEATSLPGLTLSFDDSSETSSIEVPQNITYEDSDNVTDLLYATVGKGFFARSQKMVVVAIFILCDFLSV